MPYLFKHFIAISRSKYTQLFLLLSICMVLLAGCASVTDDKTQTVRVQAFDSAGREISGAQCRMENNFGVYRFNVPAPVIVHKSKKNLLLVCNALGYEPVSLEIESGSPIHYVGSRALDLAQSFSRSTAYFYPYVVTVQFGSAPVDKNKKTVKPNEGSLLEEVKAIGKDLGKDLGISGGGDKSTPEDEFKNQQGAKDQKEDMAPESEPVMSDAPLLSAPNEPQIEK